MSSPEAKDSSLTTMSTQDVLIEIRKFINGAVRFSHNTNVADLTRTGLMLLKNVPATRDAVLEFFCSVFHVAVSKYVRQIESNQTGVIHEESTVAEIQTVLSGFINENPEAWAPIISAWSLELLGKISSEYSKRGNLRGNSGINDFLQQWMACRATRTLIEVTSQCLQCLIYSDTESCIKSLLDTSLVHSPYFDWVVTHVGSCFPNTVITRVLSCGLKDFCAMGYEQDVKNPKLNSVIGILGHLAASHSHEIRNALLQLFKWSLEENIKDDAEIKAQKLATVPFLLNLATLSNTLLKAITTDFLQILKPEMIPHLSIFASSWCKYFNNQPDQLIDLSAELALGCEQDSLQILNILLDTSLSTSNVGYHSVNVAQSVKSVCRQILELILKKLDQLIRTQDSQNQSVALLTSLKNEFPKIKPLLLNANPLKVQTAVKLISLLGNQSQNILVTAAQYLLENSVTNFHLAALVKLVEDNSVVFCSKKIDVDNSIIGQNFFSQVVERSVREALFLNWDEEEKSRKTFQNITVLLRWENSGKVPSFKSKFASNAVKNNYEHIACLLLKVENLDLANDIAQMIDSVGPPEGERYLYNESCTVKLKLTRALLRFFFNCIGDEDLIRKLKGIKIVCRCLRELTTFEVKKESNQTFDGRNHVDMISHSAMCARHLALRELLERSIFNEQAKLFGAKEKFQQKTEDCHLLQQNHKQGTSVMLAQRQSSVFHAGIIGNGPRKLPPENPLDEETITLNRMLLMDAIKACCTMYENRSYVVHSQFFKAVSLLLVELISPDVMYNGLPWPDEEFTKVTVERDLQIRRTFKEVPLLWTLLELTAWYRPSLATCSVLLRAIAATVIANWNLSEGVALTNVMALGQLLPPPLASIRDVLPILDSTQINTIMRDCIWAYMHENVPTPALFIQVEGANIAWRDIDTSTTSVRFTETLRLLLLANIHNLGSLYNILFFDPNK